MRRLIIIAILAASAVIAAKTAMAASLTVTGGTTVPRDSAVIAEVRLDSAGQSVNALDVSLSYDPAALSPTAIIANHSFLSLVAEAPAVVSPGVIQFSGGHPEGAVVVDAPLVTMAFRALHTGVTAISIRNDLSSVYLNDGIPTPAALSSRSLNINVINTLNLVSQPRVISHPNESSWSAVRTVSLEWDVVPNEEVSYRLSKNLLDLPELFPSENTGAVEFPNMSDGTWYVTFMERARGQEWSAIVRRVVLIDGNPPGPFTVEQAQLQSDGKALLSYHATDAVSGVAAYRTVVTERDWWNPWQPQRKTYMDGEYVLLDHPDETALVVVTAIDRAGNERTAKWIGPNHNQQQLFFAGVLVIVTIVCAIMLFYVVRFSRAMRKRSRGTGS